MLRVSPRGGRRVGEAQDLIAPAGNRAACSPSSAALRKAANPGEIALAKELASDGILELGAIEPLGAEVLGEPGFVWRGAEAGERRRLSLDLDA